MGRLHVHEFTTLDGVIDAPHWVADYAYDPRIEAATIAVVDRCSELIFGRRTYEHFEPAWSVRTAADDAIAPFFNESTKHVVSGSLQDPTWRNTRVLGPYDPDAIRRVKDEATGDVFCSASGTLVQAMINDGLVDELHLFVYPLTRGTGPRLFPDGAPPQRLELINSEAYQDGVLYLNYRLAPTT